MKKILLMALVAFTSFFAINTEINCETNNNVFCKLLNKKAPQISAESFYQNIYIKIQNGSFDEALQFLKSCLKPNDYSLIETEIKNMQLKLTEIIKQDPQNSAVNIETLINKTIEKTKSTSIYSAKLLAKIIAGIFVAGIAFYAVGMGIEKGIEIYEKSNLSLQDNVKAPIINTIKKLLIKSKLTSKPSYRNPNTVPTYGIRYS